MEGVVDDPFTRRKTRPKFSNTTKEEPEMTSELLMKLEQERRKVEEKKVEEKKKEDFLIKMPKALTEKPVLKHDLFDAHDFDVEINVNEIQVLIHYKTCGSPLGGIIRTHEYYKL